MKPSVFALVLSCAALVTAHAATSPYAGEERRSIKTLSPTEQEDYLAGRGMGFAKAAELNSYPGPRHVLDLAEELALSELQRKQIESVFDTMQSQAKLLGVQIVDREQELNRLFAENGASYERLQKLVNEIARLQGELRYTHLRAHIATRAALTPHQIKRYDMLRGYGTDTKTPRPHSH
jgi:Spy/CpxP family protein refolding chaperone